MRLYHGSNQAVQNPNPAFSKRSRMDFGRGFYTTSSEEQAERFTNLVFERRKSIGIKTISTYEFDIEGFKNLNIKNFQGASEEWFDYVESNRRSSNGLAEDYDVIIGPVADDNIQQTFIIYEQGIIDKNEALKRLKSEILKDQFVFKTDKSISYLTYINKREVK